MAFIGRRFNTYILRLYNIYNDVIFVFALSSDWGDYVCRFYPHLRLRPTHRFPIQFAVSCVKCTVLHSH